MKTFHLKFRLYIAFSILLLISSSSYAFAPPLSDTIRLSDFMSHCINEKYVGERKDSVSDSISVYETPYTKMYFLRYDFWPSMDDTAPLSFVYARMNHLLKILFENRLICGDMFYESYKEKPIVPDSTIQGNIKPDRIIDSMLVMSIYDMSRKLQVTRKEQYRLFEIRISHDFFGGGGTYRMIYLLLLHNTSADEETGIDEYINECDLRCFTYWYMEI